MVTARVILKTYFETGKKPTQQEFENFIDSFLHANDNLQQVIGVLASINEAEQGVVNDRYMTPFLTKAAIDFQVIDGVPSNRNTLKKLNDVLGPHVLSFANPHVVTKAQVGLGTLPDAKSDDTNTDDSNVLATSKAVRDARLSNYDLIQLKQNSSNAVTYVSAATLPNPSLYNPATVLLETGSSRIYIKDLTNWVQVS